MSGEILLSTAYFPPAEYFSHILNAPKVIVEKEENYIKQTYRNRCRILTATGIQILSVPVIKGSQEGSKIKNVLIDYSKRWQQVHIRALISSYNRSPYFQFYFEDFEKILLENHKLLLDLNDKILKKCLGIIGVDKCIEYTSFFRPQGIMENDFRYTISPKKSSEYRTKKYIQVFSNNKFVPGLSILDLIFNTGPESSEYLQQTIE
jgi:hypothetical protein